MSGLAKLEKSRFNTKTFHCNQCSNNATNGNFRNSCLHCISNGISCQSHCFRPKTQEQIFQNVDTFQLRPPTPLVKVKPKPPTSFQNVIPLLHKPKKEKKRVSKKNKKINSELKIIFSEYKVSKSFDLTLWSKSFSRWHSSFDSISLFYGVLKLTRISIEQLDKESGKILFTYLNNLCRQKKQDYSLVASLDLKETEMLLAEATDAFFYYENSLIPLFTRYTYECRPRSMLLKLSVWKMGLLRLKSSVSRDTLLYKINLQILSLVKPTQLTVSLDTFQALLILTINPYGEPPASWKFFAFSALHSIVPAIGLQFSQIKPGSSDLELERVLALRFLLFRSTEITRQFIPFFNCDIMPQRASILNITEFYLTRAIASLSKPYLLIGDKFWDILDFITVAYNECQSLSSRVFLEMRTLSAASKASLDRYIDQIDELYDKYYQLLACFHAKAEQVFLTLPDVPKEKIMKLILQALAIIKTFQHYSIMTIVDLFKSRSPPASTMSHYDFIGIYSALHLIELCIKLSDCCLALHMPQNLIRSISFLIHTRKPLLREKNKYARLLKTISIALSAAQLIFRHPSRGRNDPNMDNFIVLIDLITAQDNE
ncbi:hypothetical protein DSO57_1030862 [Entomophthora muscae]|uniref:Uncharacterized protein n=1 Tax=Entomophthora muscae TaxID=34485 RepID=A0ACC2SE71_9FUNG|nr:hypothetical protein DSO57_1030862 [Entomophthora muscae]